MSIFVIGDLHLSFNNPKPMDIFGENWAGHEEKIRENWIKNVNEQDLVILLGDFSWGTYLENTKPNIDFLYNNSFEYDNKIICGARGWSILDDEVNQKFINRELIRLELSLKDGTEKYGEEKEKIVFMHYPPITKSKINEKQEIVFVEMMKKYNVKKCYYAHLHSTSINDAIEGEVEGIQFKLVSADKLDFKLLKIEDSE